MSSQDSNPRRVFPAVTTQRSQFSQSLPVRKSQQSTTAIRELEEEVGLKAESLTDFGEMYPSCGYTNEKIHLYKANNLSKVDRHLDPDENIDVYYFSLDEVLEKIKNNEIKDAKTICLVLKYNESTH